MQTDLIKNYYNSLGAKYLENWREKEGMSLVCDTELNFVSQNLSTALSWYKSAPWDVLDIGVGAGRIGEILLRDKQVKYFGLDISEEMVSVCEKKFCGVSGFREVKICDISEGISHNDNKFVFISCIRVLKYNSNWRFILKDIYRVLAPDGTLVFTIPNKYSLNYFSRGELPMFHTSISEISSILREVGFRHIEISPFGKIPDILFFSGRSMFLKRTLLFLDRLLGVFLGPQLSRVLYISCRK